MPNLSNYGHFVMILSVCCDIAEKHVLILLIFAHAGKISSGSVPNVSNYGHFFIHI